jgi:predicted nucleotide-binding protein
MESSMELFQRLISEGATFTYESAAYCSAVGGRPVTERDKPAWLAWKTRSRNLVLQSAADDSPAALMVNEGWHIVTSGRYVEEFEKARAAIVGALKLCLESIQEDTFGELRANRSVSTAAFLSNKIFIVHGHDEALKTDVERFVQQIGLEPVVLHRQPDKGQTIIEKFESNSDVGYAFILLTPDETAYTKDQELLRDAARKKEDRARPNVIFEFGYFVGRLGRDRVCCIHKPGVVLPTDLDGLIYKPITKSVDEAAFSIMQELVAAGYKIRM